MFGWWLLHEKVSNCPQNSCFAWLMRAAAPQLVYLWSDKLRTKICERQQIGYWLIWHVSQWLQPLDAHCKTPLFRQLLADDVARLPICQPLVEERRRCTAHRTSQCLSCQRPLCSPSIRTYELYGKPYPTKRQCRKQLKTHFFTLAFNVRWLPGLDCFYIMLVTV